MAESTRSRLPALLGAGRFTPTRRSRKNKDKKTRTAPPSPNRISEFFRKMTDSTPRLRTASAPGSRSDSPGRGAEGGVVVGASAKLPVLASQDLQMTKTPANRYSLLPPLDQSGVALTPDIIGKVQQVIDKFQRMEQERDRLGRGRDRSKDLSQGPVTLENIGEKIQQLDQIITQMNENVLARSQGKPTKQSRQKEGRTSSARTSEGNSTEEEGSEGDEESSEAEYGYDDDPTGGGNGGPSGNRNSWQNSKEGSVMEPGLHEMFRYLQVPISNLNSKDKRDKPETVDENFRFLNQVNKKTVAAALDASLGKYAETVTESIEQWKAAMQADLMNQMEMKVNRQVRARVQHELSGEKARIDRLESNEKLLTQSSTQKKDSLRVNKVYPSVPADEAAVRQATTALSAKVKIIERDVLFSTSPYNFCMAVAVESKDIVRIHNLSKAQHRDLVLSQIPTTSAEYIFLNLSQSLEELFSIISTHASRLSTRMDLEKKIQKWTLVTTDDVSLYRSVMDLISLFYKNDDKYQDGDDQIDVPQLFRQVVSRIQQIQGLPYAVQNDLNAMRIKIRNEDTLDICSKMLLAAVNKLIGWKQRDRNPQVKMIENETETSPKVTERKEKSTPGERNEKKSYEGQKGKKPYFVTPWPEGKHYTSKNSNTLTREIEQHFSNCCYKCGNSSHLARQCKTYPETRVILTLCVRCRQGFHEQCRSKRKDLVTGEIDKVKKGQNKKVSGKGKKDKKQERQEMPEMWGYYGGGRYPPMGFGSGFGSWYPPPPPVYAYSQTSGPPPPHAQPPAELTHNIAE